MKCRRLFIRSYLTAHRAKTINAKKSTPRSVHHRNYPSYRAKCTALIEPYRDKGRRVISIALESNNTKAFVDFIATNKFTCSFSQMGSSQPHEDPDEPLLPGSHEFRLLQSNESVEKFFEFLRMFKPGTCKWFFPVKLEVEPPNEFLLPPHRLLLLVTSLRSIEEN